MLKTPYYDNKFSLYCNVEFYLKSTKDFNWLCSFKHLATLVQKIRSFAGVVQSRNQLSNESHKGTNRGQSVKMVSLSI